MDRAATTPAEIPVQRAAGAWRQGSVRAGLVLLGCVAALALLWLARDVFLLGFVALLIAVVFSFPVGWISRVLPRGLAVILVLLGLMGLLVGLGAAAAPTLARQATQLTDSAPRALSEARAWLQHVEVKTGGVPGKAAGSAAGEVPKVMGQVTAQALPALIKAVGGIAEVVLVVVLAAFLVYKPDTYRRGLRQLVPLQRQPVFDELWGRLRFSLRHWVGGILVSMAIMGTLAAVGLLLAGIEGWLMLGVLTFLGTFVPYLGAVSSAVPGLLAGLAQSPHHLLMAALVYLGVHVVEGYLVQPLVMRRAVELNPALLLFGQGVLGAVFGVLGIVVATPLLVCGQVTVEYLWVERHVRRQAVLTASAGTSQAAAPA
jgi:predicted PurR-regulated permease PerM